MEVFGRAADYDTGNDSMVRVVANDVRKRLVQYYSQNKHEEELRIEIPLRSYVASFSFPRTETRQSWPRAFKRILPSWYIWGPLAAFAATLIILIALRPFLFPSAIDRFWAPVLKNSHQILIGVGTPLKSDSLPGGSSAPGSAKMDDAVTSEKYTDVGENDMKAVEELTAFLQGKGKTVVVRPTGAIQSADLQSRPMISLSRFLGNQLALLEPGFRFRFRRDDSRGVRWIEDKKDPSNLSWSVGTMSSSSQVNVDYALITRVWDQENGKWFIGISGLTGMSTRALSHMLIDRTAMATLNASLPKGWDQKNLQIVLEVKLTGGSPQVSRVCTSATW